MHSIIMIELIYAWANASVLGPSGYIFEHSIENIILVELYFYYDWIILWSSCLWWEVVNTFLKNCQLAIFLILGIL